MTQMKDWLGTEHARNKANADLYTRLIQRAVKKLSGCESIAVLIGHHLTFELNADLETENEIPSADCLMFDHALMGAVFGEAAVPLMQELAALPCEERDKRLSASLATLEAA